MIDSEAHPAYPIRLLLVEDDTAATARIRKLLENSEEVEFEIGQAIRVEEALQMLRDGDYQVVLLDLSLPEGDGLETLARAKVAAASVPIVVMTEDDDEDLALNALRLGAQDYVTKDRTDPRLMVRTLRRAVERYRTLTELSLSRQREHFLATHDSLTGLANRFQLEESLRRSIAIATRSGKPIAILFLDLDRFKVINDTLGYPVGDKLLKTTAERLSEETRESDVVARLGGDEFVVVLQDVTRDYGPAIVARKILRHLSKPYPLAGQEYWVTTSIGIAVFRRDGRNLDMLLRNAGTAAYDAKAQGPNRYRFYAEHMNAVAAQRLGLENSLHQAIECNQFILYFQPQVDTATGDLVGAEALLRWRRPGEGLILPQEFVPIAEETGMIDPIGDWVLRSACEHAVRWEGAKRGPIRVGVNVSTLQLGRKGFADDVLRILRETGLEPSRLELEITESAVLHPRGVTMATLLVLRRFGVRISIDDFGTGYSSLIALKRLPADGIKIDRAFIKDVASDPANATIATALIEMANGLGLAVIAEGVETREQMQFLRAHACDAMQGYLLGEPASPEEFAEQLASEKPPWTSVIAGD